MIDKDYDDCFSAMYGSSIICNMMMNEDNDDD